MIRAWIIIVLACLLGACAKDRPFGASPQITVTNLTELPMSSPASNFLLQPLDSIELKVVQDEALDGTYVIDANGLLEVPYIGNVQAAGVSTGQLSNTIKARLSNGYIKNPDVTLRTTEQRMLTVSFGGEVEKPGSYPLQAGSTLLRGLNLAGGKTDFAKVDDVLVMRTVDNQDYIGLYNLGEIQRGNSPDPQLAAGDIVMVGDSPNQRRLTALLPYFSLLTSSIFLLDQISQ